MATNSQGYLVLGLLHSSGLNLIAYAIALGVILLVSQAVYRIYFHPLRSYPGPKSWAVSQIPYVRRSLSGDVIQGQLELHQKYGKVVRIGPNALSYSDATVWTDAWAYRKGHDEFPKSRLILLPPPNGVPGILGANRMKHRQYRKQLSPSFSEKAMREQQPMIRKHIDLLVTRLKDQAGKEPQDLVKWFNWTTFDVIGALAFGQSFECLEKARMHTWIEAVFGSVKAGLVLSCMRRFGLEWVAPYIMPKKALELRTRNIRYSEDKIRDRLTRGNECGDFWDNVLKQKDEENMMTLQEMTSNASNLVLGGSETTATLLSGTIYLLLRHPRVMEKVVTELDETFSSGDDIDLFTVSQLKYTLAVLDETLRVYPPVPEQSHRVVPAGGDTVDGKWLPEGTMIHMCQYAMNRLESNFKRPGEFIPERFLGEEEFRNDNFDVLQPFSVGPRNCIGKNLAYAEMRLILAKVLWNFEFELADDQDDWIDQKAFVLWEKHPLMVRVKEREHS